MTGALSLLAGVLLGLVAPALPGRAWYVAAVLAVLPGLWPPLRRHSGAGALASLVAGLCLACLHAQHWRDLRLVVHGADARVLVEGVIDGVPARDGAVWRFDLRADRLRGAGHDIGGDAGDPTPRRLRVEWREHHRQPRAGERWRLLLRLMPLEETRNFAGFDAAQRAFRQGIHGNARVLPSAMNSLLALAPAGIDTRRARIARRVHEALADPDAAALVTALAVGHTAGMSLDQWRVFNATGTTHLVAISGMHVTLFAWLSFLVARVGWRLLPARRWLAREPFALVSGLASAGGYALLAGWSVPTQRTWLMLALYVAARLAARQVGPARLWSVALVAVLLLDVCAPLAAGFWLSFIAVGVLLAFVSDSRSLWRAQFAVMLALMPATFAVFGGVSLVGLVVNLVAIPVISFVFVPLILVGALLSWWWPPWDAPVFHAAGLLYEWLWPAMAAAADLDGAMWRVTPPVWWYLLAPAAVVVALWPWPWRIRVTALCAALPLWFPPSRAPAPGEARVLVLDAGRGVAVLVSSHTQTLLFDTGDAWNTRGSRLAGIVVPELEARGIARVDALVLPGLDADRARAAALLADRGLDLTWVGGGWPGSGLPARTCENRQWRHDEVDFTLIAAGRRCLLRVSAGGHALLLGGDLDQAAEQRLLDAMPPGTLASDIVVMSRQASDLGSAPRWIEGTSPGLAVAAGGVAGTAARARVRLRWQQQGARVLDTRQDGAIEFLLGPRGIRWRTAHADRHSSHWRRE